MSTVIDRDTRLEVAIRQAHCQAAIDYRKPVRAFVEDSRKLSGGLTVYEVVLFQSNDDFDQCVSKDVAQLLAAQGKVGQWMGNMTRPESIRLLIVAKSGAELPVQIRRQVLGSCAVAMGCAAPQVEMITRLDECIA